MSAIKINEIVKEKLKIIKQEEGCNSYSDTINLLLEFRKRLKELENEEKKK